MTTRAPLRAAYQDMFDVIHVATYDRYNDAYFVRCSMYGRAARVSKARIKQAIPTCMACCERWT